MTYTISFNANGGSGTMASVTMEAGTYTLPTCTFVAPAGKQFKGWAISAEGAVIGATYNVTGDVTFYAIWEDIPAATYTITFDANGGSGTMASVTMEAGTYTLPTCTFVAPAGKQFKGWAISAEGAVIGATYDVSGDVTFYAIWENIPAPTYTVTFDANGGSVTPATMETGADGKLTSLPTPTRSGSYRFDGWFMTDGTAVTTATVFIADTTVSARWTYVGGSSGGSSSSSSTTYPIIIEDSRYGDVESNRDRASSGTMVTLTVDPNKGYTLNTLIVTDKDGDEVKLDNKGNGKFTFKMPSSKVYVTATFTAIESLFNDVKSSDYYYDAVLWAVENGVTNGTGATTFSPNMAVSRAQMVTFLWRAHGSPKATGTNPFTDVSTSDYYYDAVLWAVANGVTNGTSATTFSPDMAVTRAQAVTFQWRAAGSPVVSGSSFDDVGTDAYYVNAVTWAVANGITNGTGGNTFSPDVVVSRAQAVTFLYRELD